MNNFCDIVPLLELLFITCAIIDYLHHVLKALLF